MPINIKLFDIEGMDTPEPGYKILGFDVLGNLVSKDESGSYKPILPEASDGSYDRLYVKYLVLGNTLPFGLGQGTYSIIQGNDNESSGVSSISRGSNSSSFGDYSMATGNFVESNGYLSYAWGKGFQSTPLTSDGINSFVHQYIVDDGYLSSGYGTLSDYSVILGGNNHNIGSGSDNSVILGGYRNNISNTTTGSTIIGGHDNDIPTGSENVVIIGVDNINSDILDNTIYLSRISLNTELGKVTNPIEGLIWYDATGSVEGTEDIRVVIGGTERSLLTPDTADIVLRSSIQTIYGQKTFTTNSIQSEVDINFKTNNGITTNDGINTYIKTGHGIELAGVGYTGGDINIESGYGGLGVTTSGKGGDIFIQTGRGGLSNGGSPTYGKGGNITLSAGAGGTFNIPGTVGGLGGSVAIIGGKSFSSYNGGGVTITGGDSSLSANGGDVTLTSGRNATKVGISLIVKGPTSTTDAMIDINTGNLRLTKGVGVGGTFGQFEWYQTTGLPGLAAAIEAYRSPSDYKKSSILFHTSDGTSLVERMRIDFNGGVAIGINDPLTYKLRVNGTFNSYGITNTSGGITNSAGGINNTGGINNNNGGITNTGSIAGVTTLTASSTISTTAGSIFSNSGNIYTLSGNIYTSNGWISATGNISTTSGNISTTSGNISTTSGNISTTSGNISAASYIKSSNGDIYTQGIGNIYVGGTGSIRTTSGSIYAQDSGNIYTTGTGDIYTGGSGRIISYNKLMVTKEVGAPGTDPNIITTLSTYVECDDGTTCDNLSVISSRIRGYTNNLYFKSCALYDEDSEDGSYSYIYSDHNIKIGNNVKYTQIYKPMFYTSLYSYCDINNYARNLTNTGSADLPSYSFVYDTDTGFYSWGANSIGVSIGGSQKYIFGWDGNLYISSGTLSVTSTSTVTNLNSDLLDSQHGSYYNSANNLTGSIPQNVFDNSLKTDATRTLLINVKLTGGNTWSGFYQVYTSPSDYDKPYYMYVQGLVLADTPAWQRYYHTNSVTRPANGSTAYMVFNNQGQYNRTQLVWKANANALDDIYLMSNDNGWLSMTFYISYG